MPGVVLDYVSNNSRQFKTPGSFPLPTLSSLHALFSPTMLLWVTNALGQQHLAAAGNISSLLAKVCTVDLYHTDAPTSTIITRGGGGTSPSANANAQLHVRLVQCSAGDPAAAAPKIAESSLVLGLGTQADLLNAGNVLNVHQILPVGEGEMKGPAHVGPKAALPVRLIAQAIEDGYGDNDKGEGSSPDLTTLRIPNVLNGTPSRFRRKRVRPRLTVSRLQVVCGTRGLPWVLMGFSLWLVKLP